MRLQVKAAPRRKRRIRRRKFWGLAIVGAPSINPFVGFSSLFPDVDFRIINILEPVNFTWIHDKFPLREAVIQAPWYKRRKVDYCIRLHRMTDGINNAQDLTDGLRVVLGDGFYVKDQSRYFDPKGFNIVLGLQTPKECELARKMGLFLLYWQQRDPNRSRWEMGFSFQRVSWDATIFSDRPVMEIVKIHLTPLMEEFIGDYRRYGRRGKRSNDETDSVQHHGVVVEDSKPAPQAEPIRSESDPRLVPKVSLENEPSPTVASERDYDSMLDRLRDGLKLQGSHTVEDDEGAAEAVYRETEAGA